MEKYIIRNIQRPALSIIEELKHYDVSTVYEAQGKQGLLSPKLKPIQQGISICGPAVTAVCYAGDNLMIHAAIEVCQPGDVLVVATIGEGIHGMIGELIVRALMKRGVQGLIIDAGIRDVKQIRELGFPVWSKAVHPEGTTKARGGWVNAPAVCAGVLVHPGDLIMADDDGVVVIRKDEAASSLEAAKKRVDKEAETKQKIEKGELSLDFYHLRATLQRENVVYYENEEAFQKRHSFGIKAT
ncbi:4-carboxy-4-hydroxy-2-oxoadipate aldolase/oxaloacetate decarboxylase [Geobacillus zalihae]|uniref:4-carboxy-4-hydroxy-2-oxoadipate aldolase/oxaloacetate decarboxylase n=1 Tax=Geobacillus zalihae TaxID=213419 RepID=UPI002605963D|nr:4-carboxy-4-hydroxy-2-oxoadipate aldolase/oxaloacetate decarboxylase [Geobacillus zalihae]WKA48033.1 4-carboxy-4-hydroxy-2-oxoadipate aldolase/oxaloacetate decarboxylase [Geobacillus zalihae]